MPNIMEAVHSYATLGEIIQVMKEVFGVHEEPTMI
jgi:methylmalonyl-CoA mutase N-terminal domain/subunit